MKCKIVRISRKELYDKVWSESMVSLAKQYGLSDVGLTKICKNNDIPTPGRGYWEKKQQRLGPTVPPLPHQEDNPEIEIRNHQQPIIEPAAQAEINKARLHEPIGVPDNLDDVHPLIQSSLKTLKSCDIDACGIIQQPLERRLDIQVSKPNLYRAHRIFAGLLAALESRGYQISLKEDKRPGAAVRIMGQDVDFGIVELLQNKSRYDKESSGLLRLYIDSKDQHHYLKGVRRLWSDGKHKRLEATLNDYIAGMIIFAAKRAELTRQINERIQKQEAEKQRQLEKQRLQNELAAQINAEQERVDNLLQEARDWQSSHLLREYITTVIERARRNGKPCDPSSTLGKWIIWAKQQADRLDPFTDSPPSILDRASELPMPEPEPERQPMRWWWQ